MYKNKIMLVLFTLSMITVQAFAFSTAQITVNDKSKVLSIKTQMNECINTAESKAALNTCLETYKANDCINIAESKVALNTCLETYK